MTHVFTKLAAVIMAIGLMLQASAQNEKRYQHFVIHEDPVKPYMMEEYEHAAKHLTHVSKQHKLTANWLAVQLDDNRYMYVSPIENMAELDKNIFEPLQKKLSKEDYGKIWANFDKSYDSHRDYVVNLDTELSYMPAGISINPSGKPYRHFTYYYVVPDMVEKVEMIGKKFKELYQSKGVQQEYRVYRNGFGEADTYFLVVSAARDAETHARESEARKQKLGEEGKALYEKLLKHVKAVKNVTGMVREDISLNMK